MSQRVVQMRVPDEQVDYWPSNFRPNEVTTGEKLNANDETIEVRTHSLPLDRYLYEGGLEHIRPIAANLPPALTCY